jgi:hypothetical protein
MWAEDFACDVFWREPESFLAGLQNQPLFDIEGRPITLDEFSQQLDAVWVHLPAETRICFEPIRSDVCGDEANECDGRHQLA